MVRFEIRLALFSPSVRTPPACFFNGYARLRRAGFLNCFESNTLGAAEARIKQHAGGVRTYDGHSPAFCNFLILRLTISRFSGDIRSRKTMPSQWSVSCSM